MQLVLSWGCAGSAWPLRLDASEPSTPLRTGVENFPSAEPFFDGEGYFTRSVRDPKAVQGRGCVLSPTVVLGFSPFCFAAHDLRLWIRI